MGGKGIRRREKNYTAAHGGGNHSRLPPPPDAASIDAVPSKLRKLMSFAGGKQSLNHGKNNAGDGADKASRSGEGMSSTTTGTKRKRDEQGLKEQGGDAPEVCKNEKKKKKNRNRNKANDLRFEALDKAAVAGSRRKDRKKKMLEAKKKKHEDAQTEEDLDFPGREHIKFGDIVEAPPKLTVPKAFKVGQDASHERLRLQAVEAYRKRKAWGSRPGVKLPPPVTSSL